MVRRKLDIHSTVISVLVIYNLGNNRDATHLQQGEVEVKVEVETGDGESSTDFTDLHRLPREAKVEAEAENGTGVSLFTLLSSLFPPVGVIGGFKLR